MRLFKILLLLCIIIFALSLNIEGQETSTPNSNETEEQEQFSDFDEYPGTENLEKDSHLPKDLSPINVKTVAIIPFGFLNPRTEESMKIARGIEVLLEYYLDFYFQFTVTSFSFVMNALVDIDLPAAPGLKEARFLAHKLDVDYVIFGTMFMGKVDITLKGCWYDYRENKILSYVEQQSSVSMLLRFLTNFAHQLAYAPQSRYPRTDPEIAASQKQFCRYITTFFKYVDAYLEFIRGDIKAAEDNLNVAINLEPSFIRAYLFKAELLLMQSGLGDWVKYQERVKKLILGIESLVEQNPYDFRMFWLLGVLHLRSGEASSNISHNLFVKSFTIRRNWLPAYQDLITETMPALMMVNNYYKNQDNIYLEGKKLRKLFPNNPSAFFVVPKISYILGNLDYAAQELMKMLEIFPDFINSLRLLAEITGRKAGPDEAMSLLLNIMQIDPFDYYVCYQMFLSIIDTAFRGIDQNDDKVISREEIVKANNQDLPNKKRHAFFRRIKFGFDINRFDEFDINGDGTLDKNEFIVLLSSFVKGPIERTQPPQLRSETGLNVLSEELWHYALLCYAIEGPAGEGLGDEGEMLKLFIDSNSHNIEKMFDALKIYVEIASDDELKDYSINNQLSNLVILWGLADKYYGDKEVAEYSARKYLNKIDKLNKKGSDLQCKHWRLNSLTYEIYPNREPINRLAPRNLPKFDFSGN